MELKLVECVSNAVKMPNTFGLHRYDDVLIIIRSLGGIDEIATWNISNPMNINQIGVCTIQWRSSKAVLHNKKLYLFYKDKM
jgi:hypothetical protein